MKRLILFSLIALSVVCRPLGADEKNGKSATTSDNKTISFDSFAIAKESPSPRIRFSTTGGNETHALDEIVEITISPIKHPKPPTDKDVKIVTTSHDILLGELVGKEGDLLKISHSILGAVEININAISAIHFPRNAKAIPAEEIKTEEDALILQTGDRDNGILEEIAPGGIVFNSSKFQSKRTIALKDAAAIVFTQLGERPRPPEELFLNVILVDGTTLNGKFEGMTADALSITSLFGKKFALPIAQISGIYVKNGKVIWLSEIDPVKIDENPNYIRLDAPLPSDLSFPFQRDKNVLGGPLQLKGIQYKKGIGVHSRSELTFRLDKKYKSFSATIGVDDCAKGDPYFRGEVVFSIFLDDASTPAFESGNIAGGDSPRDVAVDISSANVVRLLVNFGERGNIRDYADWVSARLIKK